ncbi:MAG TPA: ScbR family autoregulator-binding transcription factor [Aldersonia sp.]
MAQQQERARRTRAAIVQSAAAEFGRCGYAAASLSQILEGSNATKGAMYFHFDSKEDLARAVMQTAMARYGETAERWLARDDLDPLEKLYGLTDEIVVRFQDDVVVQADFRLAIEPAFVVEGRSGAGVHWARHVYRLAVEAHERGELREDVDPGKFARTLGASMTGQWYMAELLGEREQLREHCQYSMASALEAAATSSWLERFHGEGWRARAQVNGFDTSA